MLAVVAPLGDHEYVTFGVLLAAVIVEAAPKQTTGGVAVAAMLGSGLTVIFTESTPVQPVIAVPATA